MPGNHEENMDFINTSDISKDAISDRNRMATVLLSQALVKDRKQFLVWKKVKEITESIKANKGKSTLF